MMMPLLDYLNHSNKPNCIAMPHHDKVNDKSYLVLKALKDISPDEQLCLSYGELPNTHLLQKYGFVEHENPITQSVLTFPFLDYQTLTYEEVELKK
jgi:hypothetical protein